MDREPAPSPLSSVDLALLRAARVWGGESSAGLWARFPADRRSSLRWGWESGLADGPEAPLDRLRREHAAQARPDPARVHPSWRVRALKHESPSVQRVAAASLPGGVAGAVREGLGLSAEDLRPDRPAHPGALQFALSLWADRLVGDVPVRDDDPPVVAALTRFDARTVARLIHTTGLAKWSLTDRPLPDPGPGDLDRVGPLRTLLAGVDPRFLPVVGRDLDAIPPSGPHRLARAGMSSFARLLLSAEAYRVRWALQHLPYPTAKSLRTLMGPGGRKSPLLVRWETEVLRASWTLLHAEGRLPAPWGGAAVSVDEYPAEPDSSFEVAAPGPEAVGAGPLGPLPRLSPRQAALESRLSRLPEGAGVGRALGWLAGPLGAGLDVGRPEVLWRPAGLRRSGMVAQLTWPRLSTRLAVGVDTPVAHAVVDRLLGYDRLPSEGPLPISPVEWGVLTFAVAETLRRLTTEGRCPFGVWDPTLDRVGPDPFDAAGLGRVVTVRWPVKLGDIGGSIRLWVTESLAARWMTSEPAPPADPSAGLARAGDLTGVWAAEAGTIRLPRGLRTVRAGGVLPLAETRLRGTPQSPTGAVVLTLTAGGHGGRYSIPAEPVPHSGGGRLTVTAPLSHEPTPREALAMPPLTPPATPESPAPTGADVPVTLVVELGRVNLPLARLADLKPGDVVELGRHSREPVELTSGGRLVARGELVLIDTELGVRVTHLFL